MLIKGMDIQKVWSAGNTVQIRTLSKEESALQTCMYCRNHWLFSVQLFVGFDHQRTKLGIRFELPCRILSCGLAFSAGNDRTQLYLFTHLLFSAFYRAADQILCGHGSIVTFDHAKVQGRLYDALQLAAVFL